MVRKTTPRRKPGQNRNLSRQQEVARRRKLAEKAAHEQQARDENIAAFHKKANADTKQAAPGGKQIKKSNALKISLWAAAIVIIIVPTVLIGGSMIGDWTRTKNIAEFDTTAGSAIKAILPLQPYSIPLSRKSSLRIESYLELTKAEAAEAVCHYMPRYKAAIVSVLNKHYSRQDPTSVQTNLVISDLQKEIKRSTALKELRKVHIKTSTVDAKKAHITSAAFPASQLIACQ